MPTTFLRSASLLFSTHLLRTLRARRMLVMAALALLPVGMGNLVAAAAPAAEQARILSFVSWHLLLMLVTPLMGLIAGAGVVSEEVSDGTITYVFSRPVSRAGWFLGRLGAAVCAVCVVLGPAAYLTFAGGLWDLSAWLGREGAPAEAILPMVGPAVRTVLLGGVVYTCLFAAIGTLVRHPVVVGVAYSMVFEALLANLPGRTASLSIQHHLRSLLAAAAHDPWSVVRREVQAPFEAAPVALENLVLVLAFSLVAGMLVIRRKQYNPTP